MIEIDNNFFHSVDMPDLWADDAAYAHRLTDHDLAGMPDGLQDQCFLMCQDPPFHFLRTAAIGRTGIVCTILTAEVFFAVRTEGWVKNNLRSIHDCCRSKPFIHCTLDHFCFCHIQHLTKNDSCKTVVCQAKWQL